MTPETLIEALWDEIEERANVIVGFVATTSDVKLNEKELMTISIGVSAGITAAIEFLAGT